jgi:hypothetical protein
LENNALAGFKIFFLFDPFLLEKENGSTKRKLLLPPPQKAPFFLAKRKPSTGKKKLLGRCVCNIFKQCPAPTNSMGP